MGELLTIKGTREGLRLLVDQNAGWPVVMEAIRERLGSGESFFQGARLTIDIGERQLTEQQLEELLELMQQHGLRPEALATASRESRSIARRVGVTPRPTARGYTPPREGDEAVFIRRTIRSGQIVRFHGHVVVVGDVNAGSEIIAGGSIIVWGRLRGSAHAGALGDMSAVVCALDLQPSLLRIAEILARSPEQSRSMGPEMARLEDGQILVLPWEGPRR
ncbi:MAG: putative septum site-determining protein MinC [Herpetosiphonaceae bacterium]|nr:MAG: putative septum site-determining protein MinC [Herpetosiphonaceae bacterium]